MTDILDLPDWTLLAKHHDDDEYELEAELAAERGRREDIRANERRALREKLICAALTGLMGQTSASETWYAERAISQAYAVLAALDREAAK